MVADVRHRVRYRGAGLKLTGTLTRPARVGRFPLVALAHGYHAPESYRPVRVSLRERAFLARRGTSSSGRTTATTAAPTGKATAWRRMMRRAVALHG